ncbi:MAG TPA: YiiX/YebB-like N1pC/P60 family cysteine hydrolase [Polyangiaceae bacterium]|jgi:uncharacterized protein YycO|nr:YiiX/YebB-like N1pC/P60 family cysteine hydrolase [Polyangiaceae bacterium]
MADPWSVTRTIKVSDLHKADILLTASDTASSSTITWGRSIQFAKWAYVSHAAVCISYDHAAEALSNGICKTPMQEFQDACTHILVLRHNDLGSGDLQNAVVRFAEDHVGTPYDWVKLKDLMSPVYKANQRLRWNVKRKLVGADKVQKQDDAKFICSEFVVRCYESAGKPIVDLAPWVAPDDFVYLANGGGFSGNDPSLSVVGKLK